MSIIYSGNNIPATGDNVIYNRTPLDKVNYSGVNVWTRQRNLVIHDSRATYGNPHNLYMVPSADNNFVVPPKGVYEGSKDTGDFADELYFSTSLQRQAIIDHATGETDWCDGRMTIETTLYDTFYADSARAFLVPTKAMEELQLIDCTGYNYLYVEFCGGFYDKQPSGHITDIARMYLGFDYNSTAHDLCIANWVVYSEGNPEGSRNEKNGLCYGNVPNGDKVWAAGHINISDLEGQHVFRVASACGHYNGNCMWVRFKYIELQV